MTSPFVLSVNSRSRPILNRVLQSIPRYFTAQTHSFQQKRDFRNQLRAIKAEHKADFARNLAGAFDRTQLYRDRADRPSGFHPFSGKPQDAIVNPGDKPKVFRFEYSEQHLKRTAAAFSEALARSSSEHTDGALPAETQRPHSSTELPPSQN